MAQQTIGITQAFASIAVDKDRTYGDIGLTKREYFAAMAMQGLLSTEQGYHLHEHKLSEYALSYADSLINELNNEQHFDKKIIKNHIGDVNEMIPYQKALQLIDKFEGHSFMDIDSRISAFSCAKQCALIAVDEIINNNKKIPGNEKGLHTDINTDYWNEVKKELEKI